LPPDVLITFAVLLSGLGLALATALIERRRSRNPRPRLIPTTPFMFLGFLIVVLAAAHLLTLTGAR
jgi:hypothetical protein